MNTIKPVSVQQLKQKRKSFQRQHRVRFGQQLWQFFLLTSLISGLGWFLTLPQWLIRSPQQIQIQGNNILPGAKIRQLLVLSYPQSIFRIPASGLEQQLESASPIQEAQVTRKLLPPQVTITVTEKQPVAIILDDKLLEKRITSSPQTRGFLDATGLLLPKHFYQTVQADFALPQLKVIGYRQQEKTSWSEIYEVISSQSNVAIREVDWRDINNLILKTELGNVHLGTYGSKVKLIQKFQALAKMKELPSHLHPKDIDYIDLSNPEVPAIQLISD